VCHLIRQNVTCQKRAVCSGSEVIYGGANQAAGSAAIQDQAQSGERCYSSVLLVCYNVTVVASGTLWVLNPLKVPTKLQAALPFKTKPKVVSGVASVRHMVCCIICL
jgi:hypothetical protein